MGVLVGLRGRFSGPARAMIQACGRPALGTAHLLWYRACSRQGCFPSLTQEEGRKEKCSPSLALSPKSSAIPFFFEFHASREPCPKQETGQKSRVREEHRSRTRHTYPSKTTEQTASAGLNTLPLPNTGARSHRGDFTWSLKQRLSAEGLWQSWGLGVG